MIKNILISQLKIGMYIHDLNCGWMHHPFLHNRFMVSDEATLRKIVQTGVLRVSIDTNLGADVSEEGSNLATNEEIAAPLPEPCAIPGLVGKLSAVEELKLARELCVNATSLVQDIMRDVRLGKQIAVEQCEPIVSDIVDSMFRMPSALLPVVQMKSLDEYTFQHSVCVSALAVAFGRALELPRDEIKEIALGGFLHDVGKAKVPEHILNKPGKLTDEEFEIMKSHVSFTAELLNNAKGISEIALNAAAQHHERFDGTGYPYGLKGENISLHGQMLAIVDVYDAITSTRVYHKAMPPTEALRKLFEWGDKFNITLVKAFIKSIGIYPVGSLVRLESNRLGIVREVQPDKLLHPIVQLIYDCRELCHIHPEWVDLSASNDAIRSHESFEKWGIDRARWVAAYS